MIVEYGIGFNSKRELVIIEFNRTTGETKYIPLVVVDGKIAAEVCRTAPTYGRIG